MFDISETIAEAVKEISAESMLSMFGLSKKDGKRVNKNYKRKSTRLPRSSSVPANIWDIVSQKITIRGRDIAESQIIGHYLHSQGLLPDDWSKSIIALPTGKISMWNLTKVRALKAWGRCMTRKVKMEISERDMKFVDAWMFHLVAGGFVPEHNNFIEYKMKLIEGLGINDATISKIKEKVDIEDVMSQAMTMIPDDEMGEFMDILK